MSFYRKIIIEFEEINALLFLAEYKCIICYVFDYDYTEKKVHSIVL